MCGYIKSISVTNTLAPDELAAAAADESSLFPSAVAPADASPSLPLKIRVNVCSVSPASRSKRLRSPLRAGSSSRGLCTWAATVWWRLRSAVVSNGHSMTIHEASVHWQVLQVNPAQFHHHNYHQQPTFHHHNQQQQPTFHHAPGRARCPWRSARSC